MLSLAHKHAEGGAREMKYNGAPCAYFDGMFNYFNINEKEFRAKFQDQLWNGPCVRVK